jgi:hypothetical protein
VCRRWNVLGRFWSHNGHCLCARVSILRPYAL